MAARLAQARVEAQEREIGYSDLWHALVDNLKEHVIIWHWVRGHAGNRLTSGVDRLGP